MVSPVRFRADVPIFRDKALLKVTKKIWSFDTTYGVLLNAFRLIGVCTTTAEYAMKGDVRIDSSPQTTKTCVQTWLLRTVRLLICILAVYVIYNSETPRRLLSGAQLGTLNTNSRHRAIRILEQSPLIDGVSPIDRATSLQCLQCQKVFLSNNHVLAQ